jgi:hypothetical protein
MDLKLVKTCNACPEQYDVFDGTKLVGYLRLRHGHFCANLFGPNGPIVYEATTIGDGIFDESEREFHLNKAKEAISAALD